MGKIKKIRIYYLKIWDQDVVPINKPIEDIVLDWLEGDWRVQSAFVPAFEWEDWDYKVITNEKGEIIEIE